MSTSVSVVQQQNQRAATSL